MSVLVAALLAAARLRVSCGLHRHDDALTAPRFAKMGRQGILYESEPVASLVRRGEPSKIPRTVYQIWVGSKLPKHIRTQAKALSKRNPTWRHVIVNDTFAEELMSKHFEGPVADVYRRIRVRDGLYAAKADMLRYAILYVLGGAYIDMDSSCENLDELIRPEDSAVISYEGNMKKFIQWILFFQPGHPIMRDAIEIATQRLNSVVPKSDMNIHLALVWASGPWALTKAIKHFDQRLLGEAMFAERNGFSVRRVNKDYMDLCVIKVPGAGPSLMDSTDTVSADGRLTDP